MDKKKLLWILRVILLILLFIFAGVYSARTAYYTKAQAACSYGSDSFNGFAGKPSDTYSCEDIDAALRESDTSYKGYSSLKAVLKGEVTINGKTVSEDILLLNPSLPKSEICTDVVSADGVKAYVSGWEWDDAEFGKNIDVTLTGRDGKPITTTVTLTGTAAPTRLEYVVEGTKRLEAFKGMVVIDGLEIENYVENPNEYVCFYTTYLQNLRPYEIDTKLPADVKTEKQLSFDLTSDSVVINFSQFSFWLAIALICASLASIWFLGGSYRFIFYAGYGIGFTAVAFITFLAEIRKFIVYPYIAFGTTFYPLVFVTLGVALILSSVSFYIIEEEE
jgi:hypothetical protein